MNTPDQLTHQVENPTELPVLTPEVQQNHHRKNFLFLSAALLGVFILFSAVSAIISRSSTNHSSEAKQRQYNEKYDTLTPSTSQGRPTEKVTPPQNEDTKAVESVPIDELDSEFNDIDTELNTL